MKELLKKPVEFFKGISIWYYLYAGVIAYVLIFISTPIFEADIYWHIRMGQDILEEQRLTGDPAWTFGAYDENWVTTQTFFEVISYWLYSLFGWVGIYMIRVVGVVAIFAATAWAFREVLPKRLRVHYPRVLFFVSALLLMNITINYEDRPQTLSFAFFIVFTVMLYRYLITGTLPRLVPFLLFLLVWVWWHGIALLVIPLFGLAYLVRLGFRLLKKPIPNTGRNNGFFRIAGFLGLSFLTTLLTPIGAQIYTRGFALSGSAPEFGIAEWQPPVFWEYNTITAALLCLAYITSWFFILKRKPISIRVLSLEAIFLILASFYLSQTNRNLMLLLFLIATFLARRIAQAWTAPDPAWKGTVKELLYILPAAFFLGAFIMFLHNIVNLSPVGDDAPKRIAASLGVLEDRAILNEYNYSGMLQVFTGHPTLIDGRNDRYAGEGLDNYLTLIYGKPGWKEIFDAHPEATDAVMNEDRALVTLLTEQEGWRKVCEEGKLVWLTRLDTPASCLSDESHLIVRGIN